MAEDDVTTGTRGLEFNTGETNWGFKGKNYLYLIGIDQYVHWRKLKTAVKDVLDFAEVLTARYQFEKSETTFLKDETATTDAILGGFNDLAKKITDQDNLVIYFSGHGHMIGKTGFWVPVNAALQNIMESQLINTSVIVDKLRDIDSLHTFLIIDACFSGALFADLKSAPISEKYKSRKIFTSGRDQVVKDGPEGGNSPFAKGIMTYLKGNISPHLYASMLIAQVKAYLTTEADQTPRDGSLNYIDDQGGDFIFHLKMSEAEIWASVMKQHHKDAYKKFADEFPNSEHNAEALDAFEYLSAKDVNTIKAFRGYLKKYTSVGKFVAAALEALNTLEDESLWKVTKSQDTLTAYFSYLVKFPNGKYIADAKNSINKLDPDEDDKTFVQVIESGSKEAFQEYLDKPGEKKHVAAAEKQLEPTISPLPEKADEEKEWVTVKSSNAFTAYQNFTLAFPNSKHLEEANTKMIRMDNVALNNINIMTQASELPVEQQIQKCIDYFHQFPAAPNNSHVKKIKDRLEIERFKRGL